MSGSVLVRGGRDATGRARDVLVEDGVVAQPGRPGPDAVPVLDAEGLVVAPGLLDLQVNGAGGIDITAEPARLWEVGSALVRYGITGFLPTVITSPEQTRRDALVALAAPPSDKQPGAVALGLHFEGPMIAASHKGAHDQRWIAAPDGSLVSGWSREAGVALVTIAPEVEGALEVVRELVARGVVVSLGHTAARTTDVQAAVAAGATCLTHLFNAMPPLHHREPGPVGVALAGEGPGDGLVAGVIADGHHVDPVALRAAWRALGPERFLAVSDATAALGMPEGRTVLGGSEVVVRGGTVRLPDGTLAGSAASLPDCMSVLMQATGCSLAEALVTATTTPARVLGDPTRGRLAPGCRGDVVLLEHDPATRRISVVATVVGGVVVHDVRTSGSAGG